MGFTRHGLFRVDNKEFRYFKNAIRYIFENYENPFQVKIFDVKNNYYI